jgi:hypothetical protein
VPRPRHATGTAAWPNHGSQIPPTFLSPGPEYTKCHTAVAGGGPSMAAWLATARSPKRKSHLHGCARTATPTSVRLVWPRTYERIGGRRSAVRPRSRAPLSVSVDLAHHRERMDLPDRPEPAHTARAFLAAATVALSQHALHTQRQ